MQTTPKRRQSNAERDVLMQSEAAKRLITNMKEAGFDDDKELISDSIEGETNLIEAIEQALAEIDECDILIVGLKAKEAELEARRKSITNRAERLRASIEQAMLTTGETSMRLTTASISLANVKPALMVVNEADIPASYWVEQERPAPKLDKKSLQEALEAKTQVPGATLDNGSYRLTIRRK